MEILIKHVDYKDHYNIESIVEQVSHRGEQYFNKLEKAKILLTGGTGFFGIWFLTFFKHLFEQKKFKGEIYLLTRDELNFINANSKLRNCNFIKIIQGDVKTVKLNKISPDHLIHFASTSASETFGNIE